MLDEVQKFKICQNDYSMSDVIASLYMNHKEVDKEQIRKVIDIYSELNKYSYRLFITSS